MDLHFIFGTQNDHKVQEVLSLLSISNLTIVSLKELGFEEEIIENGVSFEENAWIKANAIRTHFGGNVIAEDSGLEVDSLKGAPGIYSSRYAGKAGDSDANIDKLLGDMNDKKNRSARFRSVLAVWFNNQAYSFSGKVEGSISTKRLGNSGFGYDPIFIPEGFIKSFGELPASVKNRISHRAMAFQQFREFIMSFEKKGTKKY